MVMKNRLVVIGLVVLLVLQTLSPAFAYGQGTTASTINSTESKENVSSVPKPAAPTTSSTVPSSESKKETVQTSSSSSSTEATKATTETETKEVEKKQTRTAITDNIFSSVKMYKINGDEVQPNDTLPNMTGIKLALKFSFSNKNYQTGDTFTTQLLPR